MRPKSCSPVSTPSILAIQFRTETYTKEGELLAFDASSPMFSNTTTHLRVNTITGIELSRLAGEGKTHQKSSP